MESKELKGWNLYFDRIQKPLNEEKVTKFVHSLYEDEGLDKPKGIYFVNTPEEGQKLANKVCGTEDVYSYKEYETAEFGDIEDVNYLISLELMKLENKDTELPEKFGLHYQLVECGIFDMIRIDEGCIVIGGEMKVTEEKDILYKNGIFATIPNKERIKKTLDKFISEIEKKEDKLKYPNEEYFFIGNEIFMVKFLEVNNLIIDFFKIKTYFEADFKQPIYSQIHDDVKEMLKDYFKVENVGSYTQNTQLLLAMEEQHFNNKTHTATTN